MKGGKVWSTVVDYFLILSAIIGVGFASGKEICVFFFDFGGASILGLIAFGLLYFYLFFIIDYIKNKINLNSYNQFNSAMFGKLCNISNIIMLINFAITCAGMLAGADYLFKTFFGIGYKLPSIILSVVVLVLLIGGIGKIKWVANFIIPIMITVIVVNSIGNINPQNVNMQITASNGVMAVYYGLLFGVNNFVAALPVLFETKLKAKGKTAVILSICLIILFNILVFASNTFSTDMPMFELSANVSVWFYYIYFATLILALFSTLMICSFNMQKLIYKEKKSLFTASTIVIFNLILSQFGYGFIVKYLYVISGVVSAVYILALVILIIVKLIKFKKEKSNFANSNKENLPTQNDNKTENSLTNRPNLLEEKIDSDDEKNKK